MKKINWSKFIVSFTIVLILDQLTKYISPLISPAKLIPYFLNWNHTLNTGAAFGILKNNSFLLGLINVAVVAFIIYYISKNKLSNKYLVCLGLVAGGALSNAIDRLFRFAVIDFLDLGWWPVFNIADSAIVVGMIMLIIFELFYSKTDN